MPFAIVKSCANLLIKRIYTSLNWHINVVLQPKYIAPTTDNQFSVKIFIYLSSKKGLIGSNLIFQYFNNYKNKYTKCTL